MMITVSGRWVGVAVLVTMLGLAAGVEAQPASEIFLGYSNLQADPGGATFDGVPIELETETLHGAEATGTYFTSPRIGFDFTFAVHNGNISVPDFVEVPEGTDVSIDFRQVAFMGGPRVRLVATDTVDVSVRAVFGAANGNARAIAGLFALDANNTVLAMSAGASLSVRFSEAFAFRVAQPEVYVTQFGDATQSSFRVSTGIVFIYGQ
jgi:hypothetical protein